MCRLFRRIIRFCSIIDRFEKGVTVNKNFQFLVLLEVFDGFPIHDGVRVAATSQHVIIATLANLILFQTGTRFIFSFDLGYLLVSQLEATLEGRPVYE